MTWDEDKRRRFLTQLAASGNVSGAATACGMSRRRLYELRDADAEFAAEWQDALETAVDALEAAARRRALVNSDTLLLALLKAHRPQVYRDKIDHDIAIKGPLQVQMVTYAVAHEPEPEDPDPPLRVHTA